MNGFPIYVHVPVGTGKTATVNACCRNERACMLSGVRDFLDRMPSLHSIGEDTVVVDDVSLIVGARSQGHAKYPVRSCDKHLVMPGRSMMPRFPLAQNMAVLFLACDRTTMPCDGAEMGR